MLKLAQTDRQTDRQTNQQTGQKQYIGSLLFTFAVNTSQPTAGHVFQRTGTTFKLNEHIIKTNNLTKLHEDRSRYYWDKLQTKFHEDWTRNVASRVFTRKIALPTGGHVFQQTGTTFELNQHINNIIGTNLLTKFHEDQTRNVASRPNKENCLATGGHVFQRTGTTFELNQHIIKTNILTNFELDRGIIGTNLLIKFHEDRT
ncbi:hypothetical protein DPMN_002042 [Dreissena polymorpha]|uniref:Uncharacterized protein n=1 Tax=Dreissena polymorpha TaxID=45954 RepID=A0A9D4MMV7_DREPO|nr:hypothetical protein DPMN_002042 [Dreissena polymorpha]